MRPLAHVNKVIAIALVAAGDSNLQQTRERLTRANSIMVTNDETFGIRFVTFNLSKQADTFDLFKT